MLVRAGARVPGGDQPAAPRRSRAPAGAAPDGRGPVHPREPERQGAPAPLAHVCTTAGLGFHMGVARVLQFTIPFDYSGQPTITLCTGLTASDTPPKPLAFQLVGRHLQEELLCKLGHAYEGAVGRQRKPLVPPSVLESAQL